MEYPPYFKSIKRKYRYKSKNKDKTIAAKDKAWAILSDYVRVRDFIKFDRRCISCPKRADKWEDYQGGHYITMGGHGVLTGFHLLNVHSQCPHCNAFGGMEAGGEYKEELIRRYGEFLVPELERLKHQTTKADEQFFIDKIKEIYELFITLKEEYDDIDYPDYLNCG